MDFKPTKPKGSGRYFAAKGKASNTVGAQHPNVPKLDDRVGRASVESADVWKSPVLRSKRELELATYGIPNPKEVTEMGPKATHEILEHAEDGVRSEDDNWLEGLKRRIDRLLFDWGKSRNPIKGYYHGIRGEKDEKISPETDKGS